MKVDWGARKERLDSIVQKLDRVRGELDCEMRRLTSHLAEDDRLRLAEQGLRRFLKLKEDCTVVPRYDNEFRRGTPRNFRAGTLIDAEITGSVATVYLDDDGDGYMDFPASLL